MPTGAKGQSGLFQKTWRRLAIGFLPLLLCAEPQSQSASVGPDVLEGQARVSIVPRGRPAQQPAGGDIRVDVNAVLVPVTVTDLLGKPILGLTSDAFHVSEDGVEQQVARVVNQDVPLSVGFIFDSSKSMTDKLEKSRDAIGRLLELSTPADEYFLVEFNDQPKLLSAFTPLPHDIANALLTVQPVGWTALLDAIQLSVNQMKKARNSRRVLVVLSDGGDNNSRYNEREIRSLLREGNVSLYAIGILGRMVTAAAMKLLSSLAEETGGRLFPVHHLNDLPDAVEKLNTAVRDQYMLAYYPTNSARDGKYRRIHVNVAKPNLGSVHVSWRYGYYAPE